MERTEVVIDGVVHMMTDEQMGMCYIEHVDIEQARLILARSTGAPEPVLYDDPIVQSTGSDRDELLYRAEMINEIQARMDKGMSMIKECDKAINAHQWAGLI